MHCLRGRALGANVEGTQNKLYCSHDPPQAAGSTTLLLPVLFEAHGGMKERLLFHLRLGDSSSPPLAKRKSLIGVESASSISTWLAPGLLQPEGVAEEPPLVCTCVHSSLSSAVAVGFERGIVHVYHRKEDLPAYGRSRRDSEEEKWGRLVLYPTRALGSGSTSPIVSPSAAAPPDITCVAVSPSGEKMAVGTADGFVFVTQVSRVLCISAARFVPNRQKGSEHHKVKGR